jgi:predicted hydrocarbon binding protein
LTVEDSEETARGSRALAALGFDPNSVLVHEPGVLLDPHFLSALHAELEAELGPEEAATTLTQIGLVQGLHDAWKALAEDPASGAAFSPPLAIRFQSVAHDGPVGSIEFTGGWPEGTEAGACLTRAGATSHVACHLSAGYTSGWLSGTMDADILAVEQSCVAEGAEECRFIARELESWQQLGDPRAEALLAELPFGAIRALVRSHVSEPTEMSVQPIDTDVACVHIWDSVMVIPFTSGEEALRAVQLIGQDPATRNVSVVVVDLAHAVIDEAFGALVLEQILAAAEDHCAETIFASVSPLSETIVGGLDRQPLWTHKDLPQAIAAAFRIATAQRTLV